MRLTDEQRALVEQNIGIAHKAVAERVSKYGPQHADDYRASAYFGLCRAAIKYRDGFGADFATFALFRCRGQILDDIRTVKVQAGTKRAWMRDKSYKQIMFSDSDRPTEGGDIQTRRDHHDWVADADARMDADAALAKLPTWLADAMHDKYVTDTFPIRDGYTICEWTKRARKWTSVAADSFRWFVRDNTSKADNGRIRMCHLLSAFRELYGDAAKPLSPTLAARVLKQCGYNVVSRSNQQHVYGIFWNLHNGNNRPYCVIRPVRPVDLVVHRSGSTDRACRQRQTGVSCRTGPSTAPTRAKRRGDKGGVGEGKGDVGRAPKRR